ncbi:MAG: rhodanese-like domain-containing protein [Ginsengibacter sp.]
MKKSNPVSIFFLAVLFMLGCNSGQAQQPENWTKDQLIEPALLAQKLSENKNLPVIISVGPGAIIPHSIDIGMTNDSENLDNFKEEISKLPKDANIVIYCGCCPFAHCPNVRPALTALKEMKFTNFHLLNLPQNIKTDWISKGYPTVQQ